MAILATNTDHAFGIAAIRALTEWLGTIPNEVPSRAAEALFETAQNSIEAIAIANGIAAAMEDVLEANPEIDDTSDEYWDAVAELLNQTPQDE